MKSVWWLKLSLLWVPTLQDTQAVQARYPCVQVGGRSQGQVQGSECLVREAGHWPSSSRARAGPHVLWMEEMLTLNTRSPQRTMWGQVSPGWPGELVGKKPGGWGQPAVFPVSARGSLALCYFWCLPSRTQPKVNEESLDLWWGRRPETLDSLTVMHVGVGLCVFLFKFQWATWICRLVYFTKFGKVFFPFNTLYSFWNSCYMCWFPWCLISIFLQLMFLLL